MDRAEAIEIIRKNMPSDKSLPVYEALETLIPELAENDDERTRRSLIDAIKIGYSNNGISFTKEAADRYIAWLEKQKEEEGYEAIPVESTLEYKLGFKAGKDSEKQKEQKPIEWSEKHIAYVFEKVGLAKIAREQGNDQLTNALQDAMLELSKVENTEWSEEDKGLLLSTKCIIDEVWHSENTFGYSKEELEEIWNWLNVAWTRLEYPKENNECSEVE